MASKYSQKEISQFTKSLSKKDKKEWTSKEVDSAKKYADFLKETNLNKTPNWADSENESNNRTTPGSHPIPRELQPETKNRKTNRKLKSFFKPKSTTKHLRRQLEKMIED